MGENECGWKHKRFSHLRPMLTLNEVSEMLKVSKKTLRRYDAELKPIQFGRCVRYYDYEVERFRASMRVVKPERKKARDVEPEG